MGERVAEPVRVQVVDAGASPSARPDPRLAGAARRTWTGLRGAHSPVQVVRGVLGVRPAQRRCTGISSLVTGLARLGWTRFGSPGVFGVRAVSAPCVHALDQVKRTSVASGLALVFGRDPVAGEGVERRALWSHGPQLGDLARHGPDPLKPILRGDRNQGQQAGPDLPGRRPRPGRRRGSHAAGRPSCHHPPRSGGRWPPYPRTNGRTLAR